MNKIALLLFGLICFQLAFAQDAPEMQPPTNGTGPEFGLSPQAQGIINWVAVVFLWVAGLVFTFFGYRVFRPILLISGFVLLFSVVFFLCAGNTNWLETGLWWLPFVLGGIGGIVGGFLFLCIVQVGIFALGMSLGVVLAQIALTTPLGTQVMVQPWAHLLTTLGAGLVFGVIALLLQKLIIIISTSTFGAYMIATGVDMKFMDPPILSTLIPAMLSGKQLIIDFDDIKGNPYPYLLLGGLVVFAIAGLVVQFCFTGKNYDHRTGKVKERDPYGHEEPLLP